MNVFRLVADMSHMLAIIVLLVKIFRTGSVAGLSGISQIFYAIVFSTRYLDLFEYLISYYNTTFKCLFISLTYLTVFLTFCTYRNTYNSKNDPKKFYFMLVPCLVLALLRILFDPYLDFIEVMWTFSIYLEAVAIVPQLWMLNKTGECESITLHYIFLLGLYRALYIANWVYKHFNADNLEFIAVFCGVVQTLIYCPFFYMYATKVVRGNKYKLRGYLELEQNDLLETRNEVAVVSLNVDEKPQGKVDVVVKNEVNDKTQASAV